MKRISWLLLMILSINIALSQENYPLKVQWRNKELYLIDSTILYNIKSTLNENNLLKDSISFCNTLYKDKISNLYNLNKSLTHEISVNEEEGLALEKSNLDLMIKLNEKQEKIDKLKDSRFQILLGTLGITLSLGTIIGIISSVK